MQTTEIRQVFEREFGSLASKFFVLELSGPSASIEQDARAKRPGVYVHWEDGAVIRVGRSFRSSHKRSLRQHWRLDGFAQRRCRRKATTRYGRAWGGLLLDCGARTLLREIAPPHDPTRSKGLRRRGAELHVPSDRFLAMLGRGR